MRSSTQFFGLLTLVICSSCTISTDVHDVNRILIGVEEFTYKAETKADIALESNVPVFYWADTDEVGIFPNQGGYQLGFSLAGQGGKREATFNGGGWALRSDAAYSTYYPFHFENKDPKKIPISYLNQKQNGNNSLAHLGPYFFCATEPTTAENGNVSFLLRNIGGTIWFAITVPDAATYTEIALVTDEDLFTTAGTYDLKNFNLDITPTKTDKKISLALENVTTTESDQVINAYMMAAPFNVTDHPYKVFVRTNKGIYYSADLASKNHILNKNDARKVTATVQMSDGYNMGIGDWDNGGNIGGDAE